MSDDPQFNFREVACPVCGEDNFKFQGHRGGEAHQSGSGVKCVIVRCKNCTHQYPNPMPFPASDLDQMYVNAAEYFQGHDVETKKQGGLDMMRQFRSRLGRTGRFLDVGCGIGELLWAATESGWDAEGVDPSSEFIEIGRRELGVNGKATTLQEANFPDEYFDAVAMSSIIEHIYDPADLLREVKRVLKVGGVLYFDAPNEDGLYMRAGNLYMRLRGRDWVVVMAPTFAPYHVQGFNRRSVRTLLDKVGLELDELITSGGVWRQQGQATLRKKFEYAGAIGINIVGRTLGMGSYMAIWTRKSSPK